MSAVTQKIPNYLGGVSQQAEELMLPGQVIDALNAYIDPTLGLVKRTGLEYVSDLEASNGTPIGTSNTLRSAKWFPIFLGTGADFFGCVAANTIRVFGIDGVERTVNKPNGTGYLSSITDLEDVSVLTVNEYTFITNKLTTVTSRAAPTFNANRSATVVITEVQYGAQYSITLTLDGTPTTITYTTFNAEATITTPGQTERTVTARQILVGLQALLPAGYSGVIIGNTMEITRTTGTLSFQATATGALSSVGLFVFQDFISDISRLPSKSTHNRLVKIENSEANEDDYYVKFQAQNSISGDGYWTEWVAPNVSPGITLNTAPHVLTYNPSNGQFTFDQVTYVDRLVGDDNSNPHPSFVGSKVKAVFFSNNRLGFLTEETIILSQTNDFFNFYANSAITTVDTDPIDKSVSSLTTVRLSAVVPTTQGLLLFGDNQQFLAEATDDIFTPGSLTIKSISNYQTDPDVPPVDLGITTAFISRAGSYSRLFEMLSRGQNEQPEIMELTRIVPEWLPASINHVVSSPQAGVIIAGTVATDTGGRGSKDVYVLRYWQEGQTRNQAWTRWEFPEPVMMMHLDQELLWVILDGDRASGPDAYPLCRLNLNQQNSSSSINYTYVPTGLSALGKTIRSEPRLDYFADIPTGDLVWDPNFSDFGATKVYLPANFTPPPPTSLAGNAYNLSNCIITANPLGTELDGGLFRTNLPITLETSGAFSGRYYITVASENLTAYTATIVYGYLYTCGIELPQTYFRTNENMSDFTASLTIHRMKFVYGITGPMQYLLRARGRSDASLVQAVTLGDYYLANTVPITNSAIYNVPIHQKSDNFSIRIDSPTSYPFTLLSSSWEGNYNPRFYRRV